MIPNRNLITRAPYAIRLGTFLFQLKQQYRATEI